MWSPVPVVSCWILVELAPGGRTFLRGVVQGVQGNGNPPQYSFFMKCSLGISNFLEEISSLSHSVVFLYFFALIAEEGFLISPCYSL